MLKQIVLGIVLLAGLQVETAWADDALNKALYDATFHGDKMKVVEFISKGADVNARDDFYGETPLHNAAKGGEKEIAELLISKGADVNARIKSPTDMKNNEGETPLHKAASFTKLEVAELLVSKGADVHAKGGLFDRTPLHMAAGILGGDKTEVIELLISKGADVNAKDNLGQTPLDNALTYDRKKPAELLQSAMQKQNEMTALLQSALQNQSGNQREVLNRVMDNYKTRVMSDAIRRPFIALAAKLKPAPAVPEEAIKYEGRAQFAFKNAESPADVLSAAKEYEKAVAVAPWVPGYYSDLCTIYEKAKKYAEAKKNCEFFLASSPSAQEASDTNKRIAGLEFAIEKANSPGAKGAKEKERAASVSVATALTVEGEWYASAQGQGRNGWWFRVRRPASVEVFFGNKPFNDAWDAVVADTRLEVKISVWGYGDPSYKQSGYRYSCTLIESGAKLRCSRWGWGEGVVAGESVDVFDRR